MRLPAKNVPEHVRVAWWVRQSLDVSCFAPFTGQDYPAWNAFVYLVQCWCHGGGEDAIAAMRTTVRCAQPRRDILTVFVQAIPAVGDWCHVAQLWPRISEGLVVPDIDVRMMAAIERWGNPERITLHGWSGLSALHSTGSR